MDTVVVVLALTGFSTILLILILALFEPGLPYRIAARPSVATDSNDFARILAVVSDAHLHAGTSVEVLTNGPSFYEGELDAIRAARSHICLEAYIFQKGDIASRYISALAERARDGVEVRIVLDAVGSFNTWRSTFRELIDAGGQVRWYMPLRWYNVTRFNHRTHREILVVDGEVAFVGGAGIADHWYKSRPHKKRWRDTMFRIRGGAVGSIQSVFAENWLQSSGELLTASKYYPAGGRFGTAPGLVVNSTPSYGRANRARMVFQILIATATRSIHITTPYFLPDSAARRALIGAMARGVDLKIIVPGKHSDHLLTRRSSRRLFGDLLQHGAQIFEYRPSMIHTKSLVVDGLWTVVGSTNFDSRSFGINDEVNVAVLDEGLAARLEQDFEADLADSRQVSYHEWRHRPAIERVSEFFGWIIERQE